MDIPPSQTLYVKNLNEKIKKQPLKKALYQAFSQFGKIIEIVACRGLKLRGQAWICFETVEAATNAMAKMQNHPFFDKPMQIFYSKNKSDVVARKDGTYKPREKRRREPAPTQQQPAAEGSAPTAASNGQAARPVDLNAPPSNVLFAQNLPEDCNDAMLTLLFKVHGGFKEVRMVPGKKGLAFVEFEHEHQATTALQSLNGFKLTPTVSMHLSYAKR